MHKAKKTKPAKTGQKLRRCLMCGSTFPSEGQHNHVCKRCKGTQAWRDGTAIRDIGT